MKGQFQLAGYRIVLVEYWNRVQPYFFIFSIYMLVVQFSCAQEPEVLNNKLFADSVISSLDQLESTEDQLSRLYELTTATAEFDSDKAYQLAIGGIEKSKAYANDEMLMQFQYELAFAKVNQGQYDEALKVLGQIQTQAEKENNISHMARAIKWLGFVHINKGEFLHAMTLLLEALKMYESLNDQEGAGKVHVHLSNAFYYLERYDEGVTHGEKGAEIFNKLGDDYELLDAYQLIADSYLGLQKQELALEYIDKSLELANEVEIGRLAIASLHNTRGNILKHMARYDESVAAYKTSNLIVTELKHPAGMSATLANLSDVHMRKREYDKALPYQLESYELMNKHGFHMNRIENVNNLSEIYKNLGNYKKALELRELHQSVSDSIFSVEKERIAEELSTQYETEKKEALITLQQEKISRQKRSQYLTLGLAASLGLFLFLLYRNFRQKREHNDLLSKANKQLELKNNENELLLKEIHHRVKNNLQTISSLLSLQSESIRDQSAWDAVQESKNRVASMALIHQKLYQRENLAAIEMRDYFETIGKAIIDSFGSKAEGVSLKVDMSEIELDVDTAVPVGLITNELITNSLKHAFSKNKGGQISIALTQEEANLLKLEITDNGQNNSDNSETNTSEGFGALLIQLLTTQLRGRMEKTTQHGTSTKILFSLREKSVA